MDNNYGSYLKAVVIASQSQSCKRKGNLWTHPTKETVGWTTAYQVCEILRFTSLGTS